MDAYETDNRTPAKRKGRIALSSVVAGLGLTLTAGAAFGGIGADSGRDHPDCKVVRDCVYDDPPRTTIVRGPEGVTSDPTPTFRFASNEKRVSYRCRVDDQHYDECDNPHTTGHLPDGRHSLDVYAVDHDGVRDKTPAHAEFAVDTDDPSCNVVSGPQRTRDRTPVFGLRSNDRQAKFEFKLDKGRYHRTGSKVELRKLKAGRHLLQVRSIDRAGNRDHSPDAHRFKVVRKHHRH